MVYFKICWNIRFKHVFATCYSSFVLYFLLSICFTFLLPEKFVNISFSLLVAAHFLSNLKFLFSFYVHCLAEYKLPQNLVT